MAGQETALLPPGGQRILFIQAHPDDADHLCGGTVARLAEEGRNIHYLFVTRGDKGSDDPEMTSERLAVIREEEQRAAAQVLGVQEVTFFDGYFDGEVVADLELRKKLTFFIRQWKPDTVFTFDPWRRNEVHPDHRAIGICTVDALNASRGRMYYPEQLKENVTIHSVKHIYYFSTDKANHWVDISSVLDKKSAALKCHASQMGQKDPDTWVRRRGMIAGVEHRYAFAEAFHHYKIG
ncbi:GlcNAc-PI de-N-acetylase [Dictyobacter vulcani]|uniref:GlcNAc-PI de-N-acetylase n=1 Tax=Dictyobacter vulcani TaxID=2607529 RepID=A0A5J4KTG0_9CHLR|nr:PIG-L deacetylase family protein [Dictyobacter vulcani]GER89707.1 GlcNAc-PI de-N-acetylase [Dictyobacter vulcani]